MKPLLMMRTRGLLGTTLGKHAGFCPCTIQKSTGTQIILGIKDTDASGNIITYNGEPITYNTEVVTYA